MYFAVNYASWSLRDKPIRHFSWFDGCQDFNILPLTDGVIIQPRFAVLDAPSYKGERTFARNKHLVRSQMSREKAISFAQSGRFFWKKRRQELIEECGYLTKATALRTLVQKDTPGIPHHSFALHRLRNSGNIRWSVKRVKDTTPNLLFLAGWSNEGHWLVSFDVKARIDTKNTTAEILNTSGFSENISIPDHDLYQPPATTLESVAVAALFNPGQNLVVMTKWPGEKLTRTIYKWNGKDLFRDFIRIWSIDWA